MLDITLHLSKSLIIKQCEFSIGWLYIKAIIINVCDIA